MKVLAIIGVILIFVVFMFQDSPLVFNRLLAVLETPFSLGYSGCVRCHRHWNFVDGHLTPYKKGRAMFPLCETCWRALTPEQRLPYYRQLLNEWNKTSTEADGYGEVLWPGIKESVLAGN